MTMRSRKVVAIRHVPFEDLGTFEQPLRERGFDINYVDAGLNKIGDETIYDADLLIVLGGPIGVNDTANYPFLVDEAHTIRAWLDYHLPILGICLGAQLIARALGAEVRPIARPEIGFEHLALTKDGQASVLSDLEDTPVLHWHAEAFDLPAGATRLASTRGCANQAFSLGPNVLALQPHLEANPVEIERWLIGHAHELAANRVEVDQIRRDAEVHGRALARTGHTVLGRWLDQVESPF